MNIIISGGHLTPALALIEYIQDHKPKDTITFVGRLYSKKNKQQISQEKKEVEALGVPFIPFKSVKLSTNSLNAKISVVPKLIAATFSAVAIIAKVKPDIFISFGGYLAVPIAFACWIMRVPIITHEQTRSAGVANIIIAKLARKIAISYPESKKYFPQTRTVLSGNLIRASVLKKNKIKPKWISRVPEKPMLYITGGSQGSEIINRTVSEILKPLLKNWFVIHQCGTPVGNRNYKKELSKMKQQLSVANRKNYYIREWISQSELSWIYTNTTGMISRSGANTTEEIALNRIPAILIPLPFSHNDEQLLNAQALSDKKQAILLEQKNLTPSVLLEATELLLKYNRKFSRKLHLFSKPAHPEKTVYNLADAIVHK